MIRKWSMHGIHSDFRCVTAQVGASRFFQCGNISEDRQLDLLQIHHFPALAMSRVALVAVSLAGLATAMPFEGALEWMKEHGSWAVK